MEVTIGLSPATTGVVLEPDQVWCGRCSPQKGGERPICTQARPPFAPLTQNRDSRQTWKDPVSSAYTKNLHDDIGQRVSPKKITKLGAITGNWQRKDQYLRNTIGRWNTNEELLRTSLAQITEAYKCGCIFDCMRVRHFVHSQVTIFIDRLSMVS